jgi:hypothetical protein
MSNEATAKFISANRNKINDKLKQLVTHKNETSTTTNWLQFVVVFASLCHTLFDCNPTPVREKKVTDNEKKKIIK